MPDEVLAHIQIFLDKLVRAKIQRILIVLPWVRKQFLPNDAAVKKWKGWTDTINGWFQDQKDNKCIKVVDVRDFEPWKKPRVDVLDDMYCGDEKTKISAGADDEGFLTNTGHVYMTQVILQALKGSGESVFVGAQSTFLGLDLKELFHDFCHGDVLMNILDTVCTP